MKRSLVLFLLLFLLNWLALNWCSWWISAVMGFGVILIFQKGKSKNAFWVAGLAGCLVWLLMTIWKDEANNGLLSSKMVLLFHLPSSHLLWLLEGLIGFLTTGLGAWLANSLKNKTKEKAAVSVTEV